MSLEAFGNLFGIDAFWPERNGLEWKSKVTKRDMIRFSNLAWQNSVVDSALLFFQLDEQQQSPVAHLQNRLEVEGWRFPKCYFTQTIIEKALF